MTCSIDDLCIKKCRNILSLLRHFFVCLPLKITVIFDRTLGEIMLIFPAQFIGYFMWKTHMQQENSGGESVIAKSLTLQGWLILVTTVIVGTLLFVQALNAAGGSSTGLDGLTTVITVSAQLLMILRYREQWLLWILLNILSIALWAETPAMYLMYSAYLLNSLYGYYNWTKLMKQK